jgi:hypothetical protein
MPQKFLEALPEMLLTWVLTRAIERAFSGVTGKIQNKDKQYTQPQTTWASI